MIHFDHPSSFVLLAAVPLLLLLMKRGVGLRRVVLSRFGIDATALRISLWGRALCLLAVLCVVLALAGPAISSQETKSAREKGEIVFLLDVSRSMLSDDVRPSRLERAKQAIAEFVNQQPRERVALVVFAGTQSVECPLTNDLAFFQEVLKQTGPGSVSRGGTRIRDAMRFALRSVFDNLATEPKLLVLMTDGGEQDRENWVMERGDVQLIIGGVGSEIGSALVPVSVSDRTPVLYYGRPVATRLEAEYLRRIAKLAGGEYRDVSEDPLPRSAAAGDGSAAIDHSRLATIILAAVAFALLLAESLGSKRTRTRGIAIGLVVALLFEIPANLHAEVRESAEDLARQAREAFESGGYPSAIEFYRAAVKESNGRLDLVYNLACALYSRGEYSEAFQEFSKVETGAEKGSDLEWKTRKGKADSLYWMSADADAGVAELMLGTALREYLELTKLRPEDADSAFNAKAAAKGLAAMRNAARQRPRGPAKGGHGDPAAAGESGPGGLTGAAKREAPDQDW